MARIRPWPFAPFGSPGWLRPPAPDRALDIARSVALGGVSVPPPGDRAELLLAAVERTRQVADRLDWVLLSLVGEARSHGLSWQEVADALGVSKQAAHKRFAPYLADAYARAQAPAPAQQQPA